MATSPSLSFRRRPTTTAWRLGRRSRCGWPAKPASLLRNTSSSKWLGRGGFYRGASTAPARFAFPSCQQWRWWAPRTASAEAIQRLSTLSRSSASPRAVTRTLLHSFDPPAESPVVGPTVGLEVSEIEDAGIREVLQTPGTAYGAWSILDALLTPTGTGTPFIFKEPLGQAREVKVALSGLSGRFVARAYLERYFKLSIFAHLGSWIIDLDRRRKIKVKRLSRGDLPDWIACAPDLSSLTVAEAKGCHDVGGPAKALARAWTQAGRIDVTAQDRKVTVKRIAVATRWGMAAAGPADAYISARDPVDKGDPIDPTDKDPLFIGLLRCISPTSSSHSATLNWQARSSASLISHLREGSKTTSILPGASGCSPGRRAGESELHGRAGRRDRHPRRPRHRR